MKTLKDMLSLPRFSDLTVLSRHSDLEKPIESVEITETPDVANFIPKKVMILTTAMSYKDDQIRLKELIDSLKETECAALGIKVGRFIEYIDQEVIDYATKVDLPLVKIPSTQPLGALLHEMLSYLWNTKTQQMSFAFDIQKRFSYLLMHDVSNARFIAEFGKLINAPIILLNPWHKIIAHSKHFSEAQKPASFYSEQIDQEHFQRMTKEKRSFIIRDIDGKKVQITGYPINVNTYFPYYLLILSPEKIPYPISEFAIEQAALVLTFILYKNQKIEESFENLKSDFIDHLFKSYNQTTESHNWLDLGKNYGLVSSSFYQLVVVYCETDELNQTRSRYQQEEAQLTLNWIKEYLPLKTRDAVVFKQKNSRYNILIFQNELETLDSFLSQMSEELASVLPITIKFAVGNPYKSIEELPNSYIEASQALETAQHLHKAPVIEYYHPKGLASLFDQLGGDDIRYFCQKNLKDLAYPTEPIFQELRKTLKTFLAFNCEITKTANILYLHRNTIKYRINQCEELLGQSIYNPEISLLLRVALELSEE